MANVGRLLDWMESQDHANDFEWLAERLRTGHAAEYLRHVAKGYQRPSWDLAFAIESLTGISAHEIRSASAA